MTIKSSTRVEAQPSQETKCVRDRLIFADVIRAFAILQVIYVHCSVPFIANMDNKGAWWAAFIPEILGRASVPLFLILSGMFLLQKDINKSPLTFLRDRAKRLLLPLAVWTCFYLAWADCFMGAPYQQANLLYLFQFPAYYHLGYLYFLTGICVAAPILKTFSQTATKTDYTYFACLWLAATGLMPTFFRYTGVSMHVLLPITLGLGGYFLLGYAMRDTKLDRNGVPAAWMALITSVVLGGLLTYGVARANNGFFDPFYLESSSPFIIVYSFATFLLIKSVDFESIRKRLPWSTNAAKSISDASFTMYLIHPAILDVCHRLNLDHKIASHGFLGSSANIFIMFATVSVAAWLFAQAARKIKVPHWLMP